MRAVETWTGQYENCPVRCVDALLWLRDMVGSLMGLRSRRYGWYVLGLLAVLLVVVSVLFVAEYRARQAEAAAAAERAAIERYEDRIASAVSIGVGTGVAGIAGTVAVLVSLLRIADRRAVVVLGAGAVTVEVICHSVGYFSTSNNEATSTDPATATRPMSFRNMSVIMTFSARFFAEA